MKINFKKPKYIIPAILLLPLIFIGWQVIGIINTEIDANPETVETLGEINTDMPDPNMDNLDLKSKYKNMQDDFGRIRDYAAVQTIEKEETEDKDGIQNSLYDEKEIARLDSMEAEKRKNLEKLREMQNAVNNQANNIPREQQEEKQSDDLIKQLELMQRIAMGEEIKTPEQLKTEEEKRKEKEKLAKEAEEKAKKDAPVEVVKADAVNREHFNTIGEKTENTSLIKAMLDENLKVVDGSRIRVRLADDIIINGNTISKGTYLYAIVTGFGAQRVRAKITSVLLRDRHIKVSLNIFDNDGIEGFYVPESTFRDLAKEASGSALGQSLNMNNNSGEQDVESFAFQTLQNVYQSATSAISNNIKKNKAKLKYNTTVYLINDNN